MNIIIVMILPCILTFVVFIVKKSFLQMLPHVEVGEGRNAF